MLCCWCCWAAASFATGNGSCNGLLHYPCIRVYGNAGLGSNEPVALNVHPPSLYTETAGLLIFLKLS